MDEKKIEKANILGFSDGGNIALVFALRYPQRVNKLILNGANLYGSGVKASIQIPIVIGYGVASFFGKFSKKAKKNAQMLGLMVKDPALTPQELRTLSVRTLVIAGTKDMIKEKHTKLIYENLPDASLVWIQGDHFIALKNPRAFNQAVKAFLEEK